MPLIKRQKREDEKPRTENRKAKAKDKIIFIVGPTAVGKSAVAVELARKARGEIISCDSMQVYKGMEIITSKPPGPLRKRIRHYLIGLIPPAKEFDVSRYRKEAIRIMNAIIKRGNLPVFCGGSGLYVTTLIDGIFKGEGQNPGLRKKFYRLLERYGRGYLYKKLERADRLAAEKIHPNDAKRIIRALEVFAATGRPISEWQKERKGLSGDYGIKIFCLNMERAGLYKKIDGRVDDMFKAGLLKEVRQALARKLSRTASCAIGINELKGYFQGKYDLEEARRLMKRNSRRYAKRQLTWFRKDKRIKWVNVGARDKPAQTARRILKSL